MYETTAFLYDTIAAAEDAKAVFQEIHTIFLEAGIRQPATLGDFGCGTGTMAVQFAEFGWRVIGVEISEAMLAVAREKAAKLPEAVQARMTWQRGDIAELAMSQQLDAGICLHNTINHLAEWPQVEGFISGAFEALRPGGVLVLDSDTQKTFEDFFNHEPTVVWDDGLYRLTRACRFDADTGRAEHVATLERYMAGLELKPAGEEAMALQYYPEETLHKAFTGAGFELLALKPYNPCPVLYTGGFIPKALWVLKKP